MLRVMLCIKQWAGLLSNYPQPAADPDVDKEDETNSSVHGMCVYQSGSKLKASRELSHTLALHTVREVYYAAKSGG